MTAIYTGPDRRRPVAPVPFKQFAIAFTAAGFLIVGMLGLAVIETGNVEERVTKVQQEQRIANDTAENAKVVADFIRDCIFYAEEGKCPVKNLEIIKEDNPTGNPKPTTTTTR